MTKNEIINEMYNVINNNADVFQYPEKWMTEKYADKVRTTKKAELEHWLAKLNAMVEEAKKVETVETEVENNTENVAEPKATKKDIIMGLHKNDEVKCDLETAQSIAQEGFIEIESYEDGVLKGNVCYDKVMNEMFDEYDCVWVGTDDKKCPMSLDDIYTVTKLYDKGYINNLDYDGDNIWHCMVKMTNVLSDFCKRWDSKLSEVA